MTITQKILASHIKNGATSIKSGDLILVDVDIVLGNDITSPVAIKEFQKIGVNKVFDKDKVSLIMDHFTPNKDIKAAEQCKMCRDFAKQFDITHFYETSGVEHAVLPEKGIVTGGNVVIGADSHTCTYGGIGAFATGVGSTDMAVCMATGKAWFKVPEAIKFVLKGKLNKWVTGKDVILHIIGMISVDGALYKSMEFCGEGVSELSISDRLCICNMAIEAGAKNGIFPVDEKTIEFAKKAGAKPPVAYTPDDFEGDYEQVIEIDLSTITSTVSFPHLPDNVRTFDNMPLVEIDQVIIGSCTNGRLEDLMLAAEILKGKKVAKGVRAIVIPASQKIYEEALEAGLLKTFVESGAMVSVPTCGPCLGGHMGILAKGERAVATTNRNFVGRMGHVESEVYLASPAVAAASAITGRISQAEEVM